MLPNNPHSLLNILLLGHLLKEKEHVWKNVMYVPFCGQYRGKKPWDFCYKGKVVSVYFNNVSSLLLLGVN